MGIPPVGASFAAGRQRNEIIQPKSERIARIAAAVFVGLALSFTGTIKNDVKLTTCGLGLSLVSFVSLWFICTSRFKEE